MPRGDLIDALTIPENLYWAWNKVRRYYGSLDGWYDELAVAKFEANLQKELQRIARQFRKGRYRMSRLRPLPQPKAPDGNNNPRTRQAFWITVRDQVAWLAFVNVVGPRLDSQMPPWSYGNRLYRSVWIDDSGDRPRVRIGPYRSSSGQTYRRFQQSWPLYRRHIFLTLRNMVASKYRKEIRLGEPEKRLLEAEESDIREGDRLPYLRSDYWTRTTNAPYWAGLDLEKFYPSVNLDVIVQNFHGYLGDDAEDVTGILQNLLRFPLDLSGWRENDLEAIGLSSSQKVYSHLPTGLMAAGFLANVAMLGIDAKVTARARHSQVAHFRYVDDHVVLAPNFETIERWVSWYQEILRDSGIGVNFNQDKFDPTSFGTYFFGQQSDKEQAAVDCRLDPRFPVPLMTQTLAKLSDITRCDFELLDDNEQITLLGDLEHLMLTAFPATELPTVTRVSFAAARIARLAAGRRPSVQELVTKYRRVLELQKDIERCKKSGKSFAKLAERLEAEEQGFLATERSVSNLQEMERKRTFWLLIKALQDFPEKVRLWEHVLNFCRMSGHTDLSPVFEQLQRACAENPLGGAFVRASVLQVLARHMVLCSRTIRAEDAAPERRAAAWHYLRAILGRPPIREGSQSRYFYVAMSERMFLGTVGAIGVFLEDQGPQAKFVSQRGSVLKALNWESDSETWVGHTGYSLSVWLWWAESRLQSNLASDPSAIWRLVAPQLDISDRCAWAVWSLYPHHLPRRAQLAVQRGDIKTEPSEAGWLLETPLVGIRAASKPEKGTLDLRDWVDWQKELCIEQEFDPRLGEWTALGVVRQISELARTDRRVRQAIHPANFLIPERWLSLADALTWEVWRSRARSAKVSVVRRSLVRDARFVPVWVSEQIPWEQNVIQGIALLLLGLLRRDFHWPSVWNPVGQRRAWASLAKGLIQSTPCSSWTASILEACLMPRHRETLLLPFLFGTTVMGESDTTNDPPEILTLRSLHRLLRHSQTILEQYQISVHNHQPRQLVPVRLEQLSRGIWASEMEDE